jgi:predicted  nucleic acid-binding Zn-ribbon protein
MPKPAKLLLQHQRLSDRERVLRDNIERIESVLASDPEVVQLEEKVEAARAAQAAVAARLHESDRAREDHRSRLRSREKELMSGRIRNPTELMQMSEEVKHMKARFVEEEDAELQLMEDVEIADDTMSAATAELDAARARAAAEAPGLRAELEAFRSELAEVESAKEKTWAEVPPAARTAYTRQRVQPAVAVVLNNQCTACRVAVTSRGMQMLRQGDEIVQCENCGRILVLVP